MSTWQNQVVPFPVELAPNEEEFVHLLRRDLFTLPVPVGVQFGSHYFRFRKSDLVRLGFPRDARSKPSFCSEYAARRLSYLGNGVTSGRVDGRMARSQRELSAAQNSRSASIEKGEVIAMLLGDRPQIRPISALE